MNHVLIFSLTGTTKKNKESKKSENTNKKNKTKDKAKHIKTCKKHASSEVTLKCELTNQIHINKNVKWQSLAVLSGKHCQNLNLRFCTRTTGLRLNTVPASLCCPTAVTLDGGKTLS